MRVIAGTAKGVRLAPVPGGTRPLADRAREGLFSSLGDEVRGASILDLFAGTGAVGIEALSRGARAAAFVEASGPAVRVIRENLRRAGVDARAVVLRSDAVRAVAGDLRGPDGAAFDIVFLDPPYAIEAKALDAVLTLLQDRGAAGPGALVVLTRPDAGYMPVIPVNWAADRRLSYGDAVIFAYRTGADEAPMTEPRED